jgi:uncharacterized protein DUF1501
MDGTPMTRRELLSCCGTGFGALALADLLARSGLTAEAATGGPLRARSPHFAPKARRILHIFASGGASQMDTFDPKPLLARYAEEKKTVSHASRHSDPRVVFASPFRFSRHGTSGIEVSDLFPNLATVIDELCVVRSMQTDTASHEPATLLLHTGQPRQRRPSVGSWVTYGLGSENENLPAFVVLAPNGPPATGGQNWQSAFLPGAYQGTFIRAREGEVGKVIENLQNRTASPTEQREDLDLLGELDRRHRAERPEDPRLEARIQSFELAYKMQTEALDAFDVAREPKPIQDAYGPGGEARSYLVARRLLERGVRYVQVWSSGWDHHENLKARMEKNAQDQDRPLAALILDLKRRGLLEETLILWSGEFGRTPTSQPPQSDGSLAKMDGRDHNNEAFSVWLAGGGVKAGTVYGATDELGFSAVENKVHVHDLHATILHLLGLDHEKLTYRYAGRDFRLTDVHGKLVRGILA